MESSYCYLLKDEQGCKNDSLKSSSETLDQSEDLENDDSCSNTVSSESSSKSAKIEDLTLNTDFHTLKKNLYNEEEFRSINHGEPIHIFLKIKPLSIQEIIKQKDEVKIQPFSFRNFYINN